MHISLPIVTIEAWEVLVVQLSNLAIDVEKSSVPMSLWSSK